MKTSGIENTSSSSAHSANKQNTSLFSYLLLKFFFLLYLFKTKIKQGKIEIRSFADGNLKMDLKVMKSTIMMFICDMKSREAVIIVVE